MKKLIFLSLLLSVGCSQCFESCNPVPFKAINYPPPLPHEIILDAEGLSQEDSTYYRNYMVTNGFQMQDSCDCPHRLELWYNPQDVDILGVIRGTRHSGTPVSDTNRLSPNFGISQDTPTVPIERFPNQVLQPVPKPNGTPVRIVIVDTGTDPSNGFLTMLWHRSLSTAPAPICPTEAEYGLNVPAPLPLEPIDQIGHGTHINGIVNGVSVSGDLQNSGDQSGIPFEQINVKFTADAGKKGSLFKAVCGLYYGLARGGQVFNLSWGYRGGDGSNLIQTFLETAKNQNVVIVAAAGNNGESTDTVKFWPASFSETYPFVIAVGAYDAHYTPPTATSPLYKLYDKTNLGVSVNVFAPGVDVPNTSIVANSIATASGTSMATAYVTRVVAILRGKNRTLTADQIKDCITGSSRSQTTDKGIVKIFDAQTIINTPCGN